MTDLDQRLRSGLTGLAERVEPRSSPEEVVTRLRQRPAARHRRGWTRAAMASAAVLVVVAGLVVALRDDGADTVDVRVGPEPTPVPGEDWDPQSLGPGWHDLAIDPAYPGVFVWTGSELVVFSSGLDDRLQRGVAHDPVTATTRRLPDNPVAFSTTTGGAWTGREVIVWSREGVAAWNPSTDMWRVVPDPPVSLTPSWSRTMAAWTGSELVFWSAGAAYEPASDSWRRIAEPPRRPVRESLAWTGEELYVVGLGSESVPTVSEAMVYDPEADAWEQLPAPGLDGQALSVVWTGRELFGVDYSGSTISFDPRTGAWTELDRIPFEFGETSPSVVMAGDAVFLTNDSENAAFSAVLDGSSWTPLPDPRAGRPLSLGSAVAVAGTRPAIYVP